MPTSPTQATSFPLCLIQLGGFWGSHLPKHHSRDGQHRLQDAPYHPRKQVKAFIFSDMKGEAPRSMETLLTR